MFSPGNLVYNRLKENKLENVFCLEIIKNPLLTREEAAISIQEQFQQAKVIVFREETDILPCGTQLEWYRSQVNKALVDNSQTCVIVCSPLLCALQAAIVMH